MAFYSEAIHKNPDRCVLATNYDFFSEASSAQLMILTGKIYQLSQDRTENRTDYG